MASLPETNFKKILYTQHGEQRRRTRNIFMNEPQRVIARGKATRKLQEKRRWKYEHGGVCVITDNRSKKVITTWTTPGHGLDIDEVEITKQMQQEHDENKVKLMTNKKMWTSHTVVVVDQSGSMRKTDATGEVTRSDLVWLTLATVFVADEIRKGNRRSTDVMSVIAMRDAEEVVIETEPYDWVLYNRLVNLLRQSQPTSHGNYIPAFESAQKLLLSNKYGGCALSLLFLSDGRPSDFWDNSRKRFQFNQDTVRKMLITRMGELASHLGNRLTIGTVAIGKSGNDDFSVLRDMVSVAKEYGCRGAFQTATLSADALATALSSLSTTTTSTMVEMSKLGSRVQREFREFRTEPLSNVGKSRITPEFERVDHQTWRTDRILRSIVVMNFVEGEGWVRKRRDYFHSPEAVGVAFKHRWFGCGAERLVKEFREVRADGMFVGPLLVAKDTKYVRRSKELHQDEKDFHKVFCKTQGKAQKYATIFNERLGRLESVVGHSIPKIEFLDCSVYMLENPDKPEMGRHGYLVERMLDIKRFKYEKWNDNDGWVKGTKKDVEDVVLGEIGGGLGGDLGAIGEEEEEEEEESADDDDDDDDDDEEEYDEYEEEEEDDVDGGVVGSTSGRASDLRIENDDIPQAFSCFTYQFTRRKMLVCDLQGVYNTDRTMFEFTDPAIHHYQSGGSKRYYGRSDRGEKGIDAFLATHVCTNLCRLLKRRRVRHSDRAVSLKYA